MRQSSWGWQSDAPSGEVDLPDNLTTLIQWFGSITIVSYFASSTTEAVKGVEMSVYDEEEMDTVGRSVYADPGGAVAYYYRPIPLPPQVAQTDADLQALPEAVRESLRRVEELTDRVRKEVTSIRATAKKEVAVLLLTAWLMVSMMSLPASGAWQYVPRGWTAPDAGYWGTEQGWTGYA